MFQSSVLDRKRKNVFELDSFLCSELKVINKSISIDLSSIESDSDDENCDSFEEIIGKLLTPEQSVKIYRKADNSGKNSCKRFKSELESHNACAKMRNQVFINSNNKSHKEKNCKEFYKIIRNLMAPKSNRRREPQSLQRISETLPLRKKILVGRKRKYKNSGSFLSNASIINDLSFPKERDLEDVRLINLKKLHKYTNEEKHDMSSFELMITSLLTPPCQEQFQRNRDENDKMGFDEIINTILTPEFSTSNKYKSHSQVNCIQKIDKVILYGNDLKAQNSSQTCLRKNESLNKFVQNQSQFLNRYPNQTLQNNHKIVSKNVLFEHNQKENSCKIFNQYGEENVRNEHPGNHLSVQTINMRSIHETESDQKNNSKQILEIDKVRDYKLSKNYLIEQISKENSKQISRVFQDDEEFDKMVMTIFSQNERHQNIELEQDFESKNTDLNNDNMSLISEQSGNSLLQQEFVLREKTLISDTQNLEISLQTNLQEVSTQTSFEDFDFPTLRPHLRQTLLDFDSEQSQIENFQPNKICSLIDETIVLQTQPKRRHILEILSNDISILPDGRKILNNIEKIATIEWFKSTSKPEFLQFQQGELLAPILENQNNRILYINHAQKIQITRKRVGLYRTCKIERTEKRQVVGDFVNNLKPKKSTAIGAAIDLISENQDLICSDLNFEIIDKMKIRMKIHNFFEKLYEVFESNRFPVLVYNTDNRKTSRIRLKLFILGYRKIFFVYCRLLYLLAKIYCLLKNDTKLTKREIYYQGKDIFKSSSTLQCDILKIFHLFRLGPWDLNIVSTNGLVYGDLKLIWDSGNVTNCNLPATMIPYDLDNLIEVQSSASFIFVVEKESVFHKLIEENFQNKLERHFIMITGKGMPDFQTRLFLNRISRLLSLPVFILVDCDIYGIRIMLNYRFGTSVSIPQGMKSDELCVPNARWLGVFPSEISTYGLNNQSLSLREKKLIKSTLSAFEQHPQIREELKIMQNNNNKTSIEALMIHQTFLSDSYLPMKFFNQNFF